MPQTNERIPSSCCSQRGRRAHAVPLEIRHLLCQAVEVGVVGAEDERLDEFLEHPHLQVRDDVRGQRRAHHPQFLKAAEARGEVGVRGSPELGDAAVETGIDRRGLLEHHGRGQPVRVKELEPAAEAGVQKRAAVGRLRP